jgi:hypothetical protein
LVIDGAPAARNALLALLAKYPQQDWLDCGRAAISMQPPRC